MINSTSKKGRPQGFHRTAWGDRIDGLTRLADGRWKVSGSPPVKFTEADERLAVSRFHQIMAKRKGEPFTLAPVTVDVAENPFGLISAYTKSSIHKLPTTKGTKVTYHPVAEEAAFWARVRQEIITRPLYVAKMTGIEQIGYLDKLLKPDESPTLESLIDSYATKPGLSSNEASRSKLFWKEFAKATGAATVRDIDYDGVVRYEAAVVKGGFKPKSVLHRYRKIRTVLSHAIKRGRGIEDCRRALDICAMLEVKDHTPLDPKPITPAQFWAVHKAATDAGDEMFVAVLLTSLNCALYGGEAAALKWDEVDLKGGQLVTRRPKTGVSRIAMLWPETVAAIKLIPRSSEWIFTTARRSATTNSVLKDWRKYRLIAELPDDLVFSQIRDAAYTIALSTSLDQAKLLSGHRLAGSADHYVRRHPEQVAVACATIRTAFFDKRKKSNK